MTPQAHKAALRLRLLKQVRELSSSYRKFASRSLCRRLQQKPPWVSAESVLLFAPMPEEPDITSLFDAALLDGKTVFLPRYLRTRDDYEIAAIRDFKRDVQPGRFGIPEPSAACPSGDGKPLDFILVPGLGFDWRGRRIGHGRGYYDRLLARWSGMRCGIGFDCQLCEEIPLEPHDEIMNWVMTPSRWFAVPPAGTDVECRL